jgi:hypothetical protein
MIQLVQTANFGKSKTGAAGLGEMGYRILNSDNSELLPRTTNQIFETAPGIYTTTIYVPEDFNGQIVWDTGSAFSITYYANESINLSQQHSLITKIDSASDKMDDLKIDIQLIRDVTAGRWKIINNQMIFYGEDNATEVLRFDLLDESGNPSVESVFERRLTS